MTFRWRGNLGPRAASRQKTPFRWWMFLNTGPSNQAKFVVSERPYQMTSGQARPRQISSAWTLMKGGGYEVVDREC